MFHAVGQTLESDHIDLSFREKDSWTRVGPEIDVPSLWLSIGDPVSGPAIHLGAMMPPPGAGDMWIDTHYHGTDQFRTLLQGQFLLQGKHMQPGEFVYQDSGVIYREGMVCGGDQEMWLFAVHGDRRGARGTTVRHDATLAISESQVAEDQLDRPVSSPDDPYWKDIPGGAKGVKAIATTLDNRRGAYIWGSFGDTSTWRPLGAGVTATGSVIGNSDNGPFILTLNGDANSALVPAATFGTEVVLVVVKGSVTVGDRKYEHGEIRVQRAGSTLDAILAGPDGANVVFLIADRRETAKLMQADALADTWSSVLDDIRGELSVAA